MKTNAFETKEENSANVSFDSDEIEITLEKPSTGTLDKSTISEIESKAKKEY
jgi:hypothetical protein